MTKNRISIMKPKSNVSLPALRQQVQDLKERIALEAELAELSNRLLLGNSDLHRVSTTVAGEVCREFNLPVVALTSKARPEAIAWPRQIVMCLVRELTGQPYQSVAKLFGKDHGTVMHACNRVRARQDTEPATRRCIAGIKSRILAQLNPVKAA